jgi:hypothetical protein
MTNLTTPELGTSPTAWQHYSLHLMSSYVLKEYFLAFNYQECIAAAETRATEVGPWALDMRKQGYHELFTHSFIGMWAAFEAGIEDTVAAFIRNSRVAAVSVASKFKTPPFPIENWPWPVEACDEIAQKLDGKAQKATFNGGNDLCARLVTLFSWLDIDVVTESSLPTRLAEANLMRNIIMHRYGKIDQGDVAVVPRLVAWQGQVMPIDRGTFTAYYQAIIDFLIALMKAISQSSHARK